MHLNLTTSKENALYLMSDDRVQYAELNYHMHEMNKPGTRATAKVYEPGEVCVCISVWISFLLT